MIIMIAITIKSMIMILGRASASASALLDWLQAPPLEERTFELPPGELAVDEQKSARVQSQLGDSRPN